MKFSQALCLLWLLKACHADGEVADPGEVGGYCEVEYTSITRGNKVVEEYEQNPDHPCIDPGNTCVPLDFQATGYTPGVCELGQCHGKQKPGFEDGIDENEANEATIRVTICHRTCSATNPWVRITIDDDAWGGDAASGCGHQLQHNVTEDCNIPAKEAQAGRTADEIWGVGRRVDYLIIEHGTRATLRSNMGWDPVSCNNGGNCKFSQEEKDYWFYWERACPYVRHGACCGSWETGACCGDNAYPNEDTEIALKKYACERNADCSGSGIPAGCVDGLLSRVAPAYTKYCYTVQNKGDWEICDIAMTDPLDPSYNPVVNSNNCLPSHSVPVWVDIPLITNPTVGTVEEGNATVVGFPVLPGATEVRDIDPASILLVAEEIATPPPTPARPTTPAPTECAFATPESFIITDTSGIDFTDEIQMIGMDSEASTVHVLYTQKSSQCSSMVAAYQDLAGTSADSCDMTENVCQIGRASCRERV